MKYLLLVHHDEEAFRRIPEAKQKEMLAESVQLTHRLDANGQYLHASPLQPAGSGVLVRVSWRSRRRPRGEPVIGRR